MNQIFNLQSYKFIDMCNSLGVIFLKFIRRWAPRG